MRNARLTSATKLALGLLCGLGILLAMPLGQAAADGTIQALINAAPSGGTVTVPAGTYHESLTVNKNLTIVGASSSTTIIQAVTGQRTITVTAGNNLRLENLTVTGGQTAQGGGGILLAGGSLTLVDCVVSGNSAAYGGGVFQEGTGGRLDMIGSRIELNSTTNHGGGLYVRGSAALTSTQILSNTAAWHGGGLHVDSGRADIVGGALSGNRAINGNGGAVNLNNGISISGTQIISNSAAVGGGLQQWNPGFTVAITNTRFERNFARVVGGGAAVSSTMSIAGSAFISNTVDSGTDASTLAGGLFAGGASSITSSHFLGNSALCLNGGSCGAANGGGLYATGAITLAQVTIVGNEAGRMGGGMATVNGGAVLTDVVLSGNKAGWGAGLYSRTGPLKATNVLISGNFGGWAGGMLNEFNNPVLTNVTVSGNRSWNQGGGIYSWASNPTLVNCIVWNNSGNPGPGLYDQNGSVPSVTYSDIQGAIVYTGTGNINADPLFMQPISPTLAPTSAGNHRLQSGSPAINAGNAFSVTVPTDLDGRPRLQGGFVDLGAYEGGWSLVYLPLVQR